MVVTGLYSQEEFYPALGRGEVKEGTVVIFRYMGPRGAPGMPEVSSLALQV